MKKLLGFAILAINTMTTVNATNLTNADLEGIHARLKYAQCGLGAHNLVTYQATFHQEYEIPNDTTYKFILKSGIEINCDPQNAQILREHQDSYGYWPALQDIVRKCQDIKITADLQNVILETRPPLTLQMRKQYGCECLDKFTNHFERIMLGLSFVRECYIENGQYQVKNINFIDLLSSEIRSIIFSTSNPYSPDNRTIRNLNPDNKGINYGFFLRNTDIYSADHYSEKLLATFQVVQVQKEF